jgi:beta-lactam-binding protein with PASTA domain
VALVVSLGPANVTVPNVVNQLQAAAQTAIVNAGLTVGAVTTANSATVASGRVISQNPAAAASVAPGSAVALVVSLGPANVTVPNVVGLTQAAAQASLTGAGLASTVTTVNNAAAAGTVIAQTPAGGASVAPGSNVALTVSLGPANVPVPNVVGLTQAAATTALVNGQLAVGTVSQAASNTVPAGSVISSTPAAGTLVAPNSAVALVVSSGVGPCTAAPAAPAGLSVAVAGRTLTFNWTAPAGAANNAAASYLFEAGLTPGTTIQSLPLAGTGTTFVRTNSPAGTYFVRLRAVNACGTGAASNEVVVVVQ